jgi:hypothetical protein
MFDEKAAPRLSSSSAIDIEIDRDDRHLHAAMRGGEAKALDRAATQRALLRNGGEVRV